MIQAHPRNLASAFAPGPTIGHEAIVSYPPEIGGRTTNPVSTKPGNSNLNLNAVCCIVLPVSAGASRATANVEPHMARRKLPAPGNDAVKAALDGVRVTLRDIGDWLGAGSQTGKSVSPSTLNNYRDCRREMPPAMRRILAQQLRRHADRLKALARRLENASGD